MNSMIEKGHRNIGSNLEPYKSYIGEIEVDASAGILYGHVLGLRDVITFQGKTVEEAIQSFRESVDDYLAYCEEMKQKPEKPFSGNISFRTRPEAHRMISTAAQIEGKSINTWMDDILAEAAQRTIETATQGNKAERGRTRAEEKRPHAHA